MKQIVLLILCLSCAFSLAQAMDHFDIPLERKQVNLPPERPIPSGQLYTPGEATDYRRISCFYFDRYMVKEINLCAQPDCSGKDEGAYRLSVLSFLNNRSKPDCQMGAIPGEMALPTSGHLIGAHGDQLFLMESPDAGDGVDIFNRKTGKKCGHKLKSEVM